MTKIEQNTAGYLAFHFDPVGRPHKFFWTAAPPPHLLKTVGWTHMASAKLKLKIGVHGRVGFRGSSPFRNLQLQIWIKLGNNLW